MHGKRLMTLRKMLFPLATWAAEQEPRTRRLVLRVIAVTPAAARLDYPDLVVLPEYLAVDQQPKQKVIRTVAAEHRPVVEVVRAVPEKAKHNIEQRAV